MVLRATYIHLIAYGGADITNAKVNTVDIGTTSTGTSDYTGLGFNPTADKAVLFTACANSTKLLILLLQVAHIL